MSFTPPVALTPLTLVSPTVTGDTLSIDTSVLPLTINADLNTTRIEVSIYGTTYVLTNPTIVSGSNQFTGSVPINTSIQSATIQFIGRAYNPWLPNTAYPLSYQVLDTNGNIQVVVQAGTSGSTTPSGRYRRYRRWHRGLVVCRPIHERQGTDHMGFHHILRRWFNCHRFKWERTVGHFRWDFQCQCPGLERCDWTSNHGWHHHMGMPRPWRDAYFQIYSCLFQFRFGASDRPAIWFTLLQGSERMQD